MDFEIVEKIFEYISSGGTNAVIFILVGVIAFLFYDRRSLITVIKDTNSALIESKENENKTIREILEKNHQISLTTVQALDEIKIVLTTLKDTL